MSAPGEIERLRWMAEQNDRDAREKLARLLQREGLIRNEDIRVYRLEVVESTELWRVDLSDVTAVVVTPDEPRFYAAAWRMQLNLVQILVVPLWGPTPVEAPRMTVDLHIGRRVRSMRVGGEVLA